MLICDLFSHFSHYIHRTGVCVCELPDFGWSVQGNSSQAPQLLVTPEPSAVNRDRHARGWLEGFAVKKSSL